MLNAHLKHFLCATGIFLLASIACLWSWNTLSELFSWPHAQYKHVLALFLLLVIVKWSLFTKHHGFDRLAANNPDHSNS